MRTISSKASLIRSGLAASILLLASSGSYAQVVNLTAGPTQAVLADGQSVPMWGYTCTGTPAAATCAAANPIAGLNWSPVVITVPYNPSGTSLTINLLNNLPATVPTSLVIVGQVGGGLGGAPTTTASPEHAAQGPTWPASGAPDPGINCATSSAADAAAAGTNCPPPQPARVQSFATEVAHGATTPLCWGPACTVPTPALKPGTYLIESGTHPSIQGPMGLYGVLVVTNAPDPSGTPRGTAYTGIPYDSEVALVLSEIDPVQNNAVNAAVNTAGFSETRVWSGQSLPGSSTSGCGSPFLADGTTANPTYNTCYPPAVNYDPRYYLVNGVSFDRTNTARSVFPSVGTATGTILVRFVNAGLRMHVPSIVGAVTGGATPIPGISLIAEDGNALPGATRVQNEVFLAAGKTYDVAVNTPASGATALAVFDRQLSLSTNNQHDGGMQAYIGFSGSVLPAPGITNANANAAANPDSYFVAATGNTLTVADPAKGVIGNDVGIYGVAVSGAAPTGLALNPDGTFTYTGAPTSFTYCGNGSATLCATVTLAACTGACQGVAPVAAAVQFRTNVSGHYSSPPPGVLAGVTNNSGLALTAVPATAGGVALQADGSFVADGAGSVCPVLVPAAPPGATCMSFPYTAKTSQGLSSSSTATVIFLAGSHLAALNVKDAKTGLPVSDYRWVIEEDRTFYIDPKCQVNSTDPFVRPATCPPLPVESLGYNFHTANMPVVATGCVGAVSCESGQTLLGAPTACNVGNGVCDPAVSQKVEVQPGQVALDPAKRYYISVLPGDGVNTTIGGTTGPTTVGGKDVPFDIARDCGPYTPTGAHWVAGGPAVLPDGFPLCGHAMGGAQIAAGQTAVSISLQQTPLPTAKIAVFVFQDDNPLNGENDAGGGVDVIAPNEPGLGGFEIKLFDQAGGLGDATGQLTYDMFNMPVSNSLAGTIDPVSGQDACPIAKNPEAGLLGMIPTCPKFMADGITESPLAGQALIANLYPGLYEIVATPAADRIARGEEWLQTNTLDGGKAHEAFIKPNEPGYFQEFGPGGFHVAIGFANPAIINSRKAGLCPTPAACAGTLNVQVTGARMSRTPDQRIYSTGDYVAYGFTQCYVSVGPEDGADFAFSKCDADGRVTFPNMPTGNFKLTVFDQWNDIMLDGLVSPVTIGSSTAVQEFPVTQWRANVYTRTFIDTNGDGASEDNGTEPGLPLVSTNIRYRDGSFGFFNNTDLNGYAGFNEVFPFMNWLVVETDTTRYKSTGTHVVYDAGGPADGTTGGGSSTIGAALANTIEHNSVPGNLRVPGARYCASADCPPGDAVAGSTGLSTGRVDPPGATTEGWQGLLGQNSFIEFGMKPFAPGENGGIKGHVIYASTRPFDDPTLLLQLSWEPGVPRVRINLYQEGTAPDGTTSLKLVDNTTTTSWDDWAQGFRSDGVPNMNCPGQDPTSPFFATLQGSKQWLDPANPKTALPNNSQFKCFDGWAMLNQIQPAPYDGMYKFPSVTGTSPTTGLPTTTNCSICVANPTGDGTRMLPAGKYVVEVIVPPGFVLVKEEDKNILLGDVYIAPVTQQFAGLGNIFIMPDQATVSAHYNKNNPLNQTTDLGASPRHEGDTGSIESFWPCVGAMRIVPDFNSLFPTSGQNAPFAGASRPLCDRKEVTLEDQASALAKFYVFTDHTIAGHFTGTITNDFASEFDPFSPQFGEKFGPPNLPVGMRDFTGNEVARVYSDQWGIYNGLYFSSYGVNPPNPTGYVPQMSIACMNDPGPIADPTGAIDPATGAVRMITDPAYNPAYSNFCYETPFMPGFTAYMDTPVIPTQAFADGYNLPDSEYPDTTPAISSVTGDAIPAAAGRGPWVSASGHTLTITALGDKVVQNPAFSGPGAATAPFNLKTLTRHYGFGSGAGTVALVGSDGVSRALTGVSWSDATITGAVPTVPSTASTCTIQQRGVSTATQCAELVITAANGKQSIDTVTVTIGGKTPSYVSPASPSSTLFGQFAANPLQRAIDNATPGDLIIVGPGTYRENLLMWKPVRLQGVGAASVTINADAHPAGKMDPWRRQVNCLFGLTLDGTPSQNAPGTVPNIADFDRSGTYTCPASMFLRADRIPFEGFVGWDAASNGNLAQLLQEPTLMGAYEGAGITVLGRGIRIPATGASSTDFWGQVTGAGTFPDGSVYLTNSNTNCTASTTLTNGRDYGTGNFLCNPSRIDGVSIINSSQGGGAIFMHGWNHSLEVANTRIYGNHGTLAGGINVGNGETPPVYLNDGTLCGNGVAAPAPLCPPIPAGTPANGTIPFALNTNVHVHHNAIINNASIGDALFSGTPSGSGGVTISAGADNFQLDHNWISGNLSSGDGGGVQAAGVSFNGKIANNWILFNQSTNPTLPTNGGGLTIAGANSDRVLPDGSECGTTTDVDCPPGIGDGTGPGLVIDANLIMGNSAESGSGGGLRLQQLNGSEVAMFPGTSARWYGVTVTNNIIANNVAGWDGGGVSMQDALKVTFVNNTVVSNDTTASAGVLFKTLGAINSSAPPPGCVPTPDPVDPQNPLCLIPNAPHNPQPAGFVTMANTPNLDESLVGLTVICPTGFHYGNAADSLASRTNGLCRTLSMPALANDMFWQNRAFHVDIVGPGTGLQSQQNLVALTPLLNQTFTGNCASGASYWDVGVRGDTSLTNHSGGATLTLNNSILTSTSGVLGTGNLAPAASPVIAQFCNGARVPPENGGHGYNAPPGRSETTGLSPVFVFDGITPAATVDEGHNWLNLTYGPLTLSRPATVANPTAPELMVASATAGSTSGAYSIPATSAAVNNGATAGAPPRDFFGNPRPAVASTAVDIGAVEFQGTGTSLAVLSVTGGPLNFGTVAPGTTSAPQTLTLHNTGSATATGITLVFAPAGRYSRPGGLAAGSCGTTLTVAQATCTINVVFTPNAAGAVPGTLTITANVPVTGSPVTLTGTGATQGTLSFTSATNATLGTLLGVRTLNFGSPAGRAVTTSVVTVTITVAPVTITAEAVTNLIGSNFAFVSTTCPATPIAIGGTCTFSVRYTPPATVPLIPRAGTLTVTDNATGSPQTLVLAGQ